VWLNFKTVAASTLDAPNAAAVTMTIKNILRIILLLMSPSCLADG
jgi:hypothetical protein